MHCLEKSLLWDQCVLSVEMLQGIVTVVRLHMTAQGAYCRY